MPSWWVLKGLSELSGFFLLVVLSGNRVGAVYWEISIFVKSLCWRSKSLFGNGASDLAKHPFYIIP